jgi:uncharacterized membrane protein
MFGRMRRYRIWLISLILIALALRLALLDKQSLWYDEGVTWLLSQTQLPDLIEWTAADIQPPFYYLLIWGTDIIFGDSEWALRFPSTIFNILTIPLISVLAYRLFRPFRALPPFAPNRRKAAPIIAAALLALSPVMVYYSQEARMYTLLIFEASLASYLLLRILDTPRPARRWRPAAPALCYLFVAATALYTHYFALFLLMAHALYALFIWWQRRFSGGLLAQLLWAFGGSFLLFGPWVPILLARLGDDPSYWPGALKLNEALRKVVISFTLGETVFEQIGWPLALGYMAILLLAGLQFAWKTLRPQSNEPALSPTLKPPATSRHSSFILYPFSFLFLFLWLLLPLILILALSYPSPKFNPRYTLLSWPAFALILAAALAFLQPAPLSQAAQTEGKQRLIRAGRLTLQAACYLFILATMSYSLTNWFSDPRFSKDDFRALAQFVRERKAEDETVLLSSGHVFPVWAYYYGWEGWTPLPWMLRLDVNQVTDLSIAAEISEAIKDQGGVWLVTWQDEVIDPSGVAPFWLDRIGRRPIDAGDFWGVGLEHWRLDPDRVGLLEETPIRWPTTLNFANRIELAGYTQLDDTELVLFWRPLQPLPDDLVLTFDLTDPDGFNWDHDRFVGRPGAYLYPPSRWPAGKLVMTRHRLDWQIGAPPGLYIAEISLGQAEAGAPTFNSWDILDQQGRPQRRTGLLEYINLSQLVRPDEGPLAMDQTPLIDFFPIVGVRRSILPQATAQAGDRLLLALVWQAGEYNLDDIGVAFDLIDAEGQRFRVGSAATPSRHFNLPRWKPGDVVLGQYWLNIPPAAAPGPAALEIHLINETGWQYREIFPLDKLEILPTERNFEPPASMDMALGADFSGQATLLGADCPDSCRAPAGSSITLTLYWRAAANFEKSYTVFTHLLDAEEAVIVNADHAPPKPTTGWVPDEIITDRVTLTLPEGLAPGSYRIEVGLYDAADPAYPRLPLAGGETRLILPQPLTVQ